MDDEDVLGDDISILGLYLKLSRLFRFMPRSPCCSLMRFDPPFKHLGSYSVDCPFGACLDGYSRQQTIMNHADYREPTYHQGFGYVFGCQQLHLANSHNEGDVVPSPRYENLHKRCRGLFHRHRCFIRRGRLQLSHPAKAVPRLLSAFVKLDGWSFLNGMRPVSKRTC